MDDELDKKDTEPVGGPHPHAGFETVSLLLEGGTGDMKAGGFQVMTAGSGIVHTETIDKAARMRMLQLWVNLPKKDRQATPRLQDLPPEHVPVLNENGVLIKLYSGSLAGISSPVQNYVPMIVADITMQPDTEAVLQVPANFNTLLYIIGGEVTAGDDQLREGQAAWLDIYAEDTLSDLKLKTGKTGARFVMYAGKPVGESIVSHGPFIADSKEDIMRLYQEYRQGKMGHISDVAPEQKIMW